ncbi:hypothetical protein K438DRAFT_1965082 [Mycena galopus ATCC 62051]|nr:hypothetical protein K438DRAFT_1965082 [Mycena galopus ATCC 62051]
MGRLIWYHVPIRLTPLVPSTPKDTRSTQEMAKVMVEKYMAVDLTEAWVCGIIEAPPTRRSGDLLPGFVPRPTVASAIPAQPVAVSTARPPSSSAASTSASSTLAPTSPFASASGVSASTSGKVLKVNLAPTSSHATKRPSASTANKITSLRPWQIFDQCTRGAC